MLKFIPFPLVSGFTSGVAVIILSTQLRDFFGLPEKLPVEFVGKLESLFTHFAPNWPTAALAVI